MPTSNVSRLSACKSRSRFGIRASTMYPVSVVSVQAARSVWDWPESTPVELTRHWLDPLDPGPTKNSTLSYVWSAPGPVYRSWSSTSTRAYTKFSSQRIRTVPVAYGPPSALLLLTGCALVFAHSGSWLPSWGVPYMAVGTMGVSVSSPFPASPVSAAAWTGIRDAARMRQQKAASSLLNRFGMT